MIIHPNQAGTTRPFRPPRGRGRHWTKAGEGAQAMGEKRGQNSKGKPVAVVIGATSKWQSDGRNTRLAHAKAVDDSSLPVGIRWGIGGAIAQKFAHEGFFVVMTTRNAANA